MKSWVRVEMHGRQRRLVFDGYFEGEDGEEVEDTFELPGRYEVCPECDGTGTSSAYLGAFTS